MFHLLIYCLVYCSDWSDLQFQVLVLLYLLCVKPFGGAHIGKKMQCYNKTLWRRDRMKVKGDRREPDSKSELRKIKYTH